MKRKNKIYFNEKRCFVNRPVFLFFPFIFFSKENLKNNLFYALTTSNLLPETRLDVKFLGIPSGRNRVSDTKNKQKTHYCKTNTFILLRLEFKMLET